MINIFTNNQECFWLLEGCMLNNDDFSHLILPHEKLWRVLRLSCYESWGQCPVVSHYLSPTTALAYSTTTCRSKMLYIVKNLKANDDYVSHFYIMQKIVLSTWAIFSYTSQASIVAHCSMNSAAAAAPGMFYEIMGFSLPILHFFGRYETVSKAL